ncbi:aromatic acid exporter family protein [Bacillus dakarensis]|uniref:aromatic acid exporter family protein n=1 Tax=Robertmurraya dakarensis TaxID=1926278 RepID=UPI000A01D965|nr:aromatic acid exporter family protein [Bacillus dakarensis]
MVFSKFKFAGGRVVKTGIGVFVTALICQAFNFNPIFAVITAIVTIEPTASDSIKKGVIRFPSAVIGAGYSMIFAALFGDQAITYALAAIFTIVTCHKFKLEAGILVATLTAVNMIPITHDHYLAAFVERLGTTTIGLTVSTLVNILILPPHYTGAITKSTGILFEKLGSLLLQITNDILHKRRNKNTYEQFNSLMKDLEKTEQLCQYQREEWKYHRHTKQELREFHYEHKKLIVLRQMLYHIGNLMYVPFDKDKVDIKEDSYIITFITGLAHFLQERSFSMNDHPEWLIPNIRKDSSSLRNELFNPAHEGSNSFSPETILFYELTALQELAQQLSHIQQFESKHGHFDLSIRKNNTVEKSHES